MLAIDPGFRTGCKVAVLDRGGNLLDQAVIYPHPPQNRRSEAKVASRTWSASTRSASSPSATARPAARPRSWSPRSSPRESSSAARTTSRPLRPPWSRRRASARAGCARRGRAERYRPLRAAGPESGEHGPTLARLRRRPVRRSAACTESHQNNDHDRRAQRPAESDEAVIASALADSDGDVREVIAHAAAEPHHAGPAEAPLRDAAADLGGITRRHFARGGNRGSHRLIAVCRTSRFEPPC